MAPQLINTWRPNQNPTAPQPYTSLHSIPTHPTFIYTHAGEMEFDCPHWSVFENALDMAHIHYLHDGSFGNQVGGWVGGSVGSVGWRVGGGEERVGRGSRSSPHFRPVTPTRVFLLLCKAHHCIPLATLLPLV